MRETSRPLVKCLEITVRIEGIWRHSWPVSLQGALGVRTFVSFQFVTIR